MHEDDLPRGCTCRSVASEPVHLLRFQSIAALLGFEELCIEDDDMRRTNVEGIVMSAKITAAGVGECKGFQIAYRRYCCPLQPVVFVVAENGHMGMTCECCPCLHRLEEAAPVPCGFAVVREVADDGGGVRIRVTLPCRLIGRAPHIVALAALTVRKEQSAYAILFVDRQERNPIRRTCGVCDTIETACGGRNLTAIDELNFIVHCEVGIGGNRMSNVSFTVTQLDTHIFELLRAVPLDHARLYGLCCHDLAQVLNAIRSKSGAGRKETAKAHRENGLGGGLQKGAARHLLFSVSCGTLSARIRCFS